MVGGSSPHDSDAISYAQPHESRMRGGTNARGEA